MEGGPGARPSSDLYLSASFYVESRLERLSPSFDSLVMFFRTCHIASILVACLLSAVAIAQQDEGLARDFEKLSAKERARIAKEEQEGSKMDAAYQAIMTEAEAFFRESLFEESMAKFKEARVLRPYNVYPKVKIADLEVLIAKRDAKLAKEEAERLAVEEDQLPTVTEPLPAPVLGPTPTPKTTKEPKEKSTEVPVKPVPTKEEVPTRTERVKEDPAVKQPVVGIGPGSDAGEEGERVYKEGRSLVVERRVKEGGRIIIYRKVTHPWGAIDHFRDGSAVPARVYNEALQP